MTVSFYDRGHKVIGEITSRLEGNVLIVTNHESTYRYADNGEPYDRENPRPCVRCGKSSTPEGHDACLGHLSGVKFACCGHGKEQGYIIYNDGHREDEEAQLDP